MDAKTNEIPAVRDLPKAFGDPAGAVLMIDAMHTPHDTAQAKGQEFEVMTEEDFLRSL